MVEADFDAIANKIKNRRIEMNMTQAALASAVGVNPQHIGNIENHRKKVSIALLVKLCQALHTSMDYMVDLNTWEGKTEVDIEVMISQSELSEGKKKVMLDILRDL